MSWPVLNSWGSMHGPRGDRARIQVRSRNIKMRPRWFNLDWILSFFVSLEDQIARISRMKASIFFVIRARSGPRFCSRQIPLKNVTIKPARESLSSRDPRAAARLSMSNWWTRNGLSLDQCYLLALKANAPNSLIGQGLVQTQHKTSTITLGLHTAELGRNRRSLVIV